MPTCLQEPVGFITHTQEQFTFDVVNSVNDTFICLTAADNNVVIKW